MPSKRTEVHTFSTSDVLFRRLACSLCSCSNIHPPSPLLRKPLNDISVVSTEDIPEGSSFASGERMHELVKVCICY